MVEKWAEKRAATMVVDLVDWKVSTMAAKRGAKWVAQTAVSMVEKKVSRKVV